MSDERSEADHSNDEDNEGSDDTWYNQKCDEIMSEKKITAGNHAIVTYEGEYFPGIVNIVENTELKMRMMSRCRGGGGGWQWPDKDDEIFFRKDTIIIQQIEIPTLVNKGGTYQVKELESRWT